jgi:transcription antitermination factor NusG
LGILDVVEMAKLCPDQYFPRGPVRRRMDLGSQMDSHSQLFLGSQQTDSPRWYAAYIAPRHEKTSLRHLEVRSVESFLPVYASARNWNGRRAVVELPLFPGYLFVHIRSCERVRVLEAPGVLSIVGVNGKLTPLPEGEVETLQRALNARHPHPHPFLTVGRRVQVRNGALAGLKGVVVRQTHGMRLVVSVDSIMRSFSVELDPTDLQPCESRSQQLGLPS